MKGMSAAQAKAKPPVREPCVPLSAEVVADELEWWSLADVLGESRTGHSMPTLHVIPIELVF